MDPITLELPPSVSEELVRLGRETQRDPTELGVDLLRRAMLVAKFDQMSRLVSSRPKPDAPKSEDEAFEQIS
jgi:hypothetical protein